MPKRCAKFIDLVISGCDFSGTTTQVDGLINYLSLLGRGVRDLRGDERDALFHTERFAEYNCSYKSYDEFFFDDNVPIEKKMRLAYEMDFLIKNLRRKNENIVVGSCLEKLPKTYINPNSADVWIMEEPTRRGAGQVNRIIEQNRKIFGLRTDQISAALSHQSYRTDEFLRFRKSLREAGKIIIRSRSEESACYQIQDEKYLPEGISRNQYLSLPGHAIAFANPPTHIFIVHGPADWTLDAYLELKKQRVLGGRILDDYEADVNYQLFVNRRYATNWLENLYEEGCKMHGGIIPEITRFDIYHSKREIIKEMIEKLESIN